MNFQTFSSTFSGTPILSVIEIEKRFPRYDCNALTRWQKAGYIQKIRNGFYHFGGQAALSNEQCYFIANRIYQPSYISLQSALSWHGLIPEGVFTTTSVTTQKRLFLDTAIGTFSYKSIKPECFFGYQLEQIGKVYFKIADPEKALIDLLYCYPDIKQEHQIAALRLNFFECKDKVTSERLQEYIALIGSKALTKRVDLLIKYLKSHDAIR
jgi:predicted transcriptional regulator of viral defense system